MSQALFVDIFDRQRSQPITTKIERDSKQQFQRQLAGLKKLSLKEGVSAAEIAGVALSLWCASEFPKLGRSRLPSPSRLKKEVQILEFVSFLVSLPFSESAYWLSSAYAALCSESYRKSAALFFTPPSLSHRLLDDLAKRGANFSLHTFCDPACGGAAFLAPIAEKMRDSLRAEGKSAASILKHIESSLVGIEKDPYLRLMSQHFVRMALYKEITSADINLLPKIQTKDSLLLRKHNLPSIDIVICNPPFRKMGSLEASKYKMVFGEVIEAQPNLYSLFMALCLRLVANNGLVGLVTPTSFLSGKYFCKLRSHLSTQSTAMLISIVSKKDRAFLNVQQETALSIFKKQDCCSKAISNTQIGLVDEKGNFQKIGVCRLPNSGTIWPIPKARNDVNLMKLANSNRTSLLDYGYAVRIGFFVWNRDKRTTYMSERMASRNCKDTIVPLLWSSDIRPNRQLLFSPHTKSNGEPRFVNMGDGNHQSIIRRPSVLLQRVTTNDQPRRLVAAAVPDSIFKEYGGFVGENHTVILEQIHKDPVLSPAQMAELLGSSLIDRQFRSISGAANVSVFELNHLFLPNIDKLAKRIEAGESIPKAVESVLIGI